MLFFSDLTTRTALFVMGVEFIHSLLSDMMLKASNFDPFRKRKGRNLPSFKAKERKVHMLL